MLQEVLKKKWENKDGFPAVVHTQLKKHQWGRVTHWIIAGGEEKLEIPLLDLEGLTAFLTVTTEQIHFQAKAKAVNGGEIWAHCLYSSEES